MAFGKVTKILLQSKEELLLYLKDEKYEYENLLSSVIWLIKLIFLADNFEHLNIVNSNLQDSEQIYKNFNYSQVQLGKMEFYSFQFA